MLVYHQRKQIEMRDVNERRLYDAIAAYLKAGTTVPKTSELSKSLGLTEGLISSYMTRMVSRGILGKSWHNNSLEVLKPYMAEERRHIDTPKTLLDIANGTHNKSVEKTENETDSENSKSARINSTDNVIATLHAKRAELVAQRDLANKTIEVIDEAVTRLLEMTNDD